MSTTANSLDDVAFIKALLDTVIPPGGSGGMPGAGSLGIEADVAAAIEGDLRSGPMIRAGMDAIADAAGRIAPGGLAGLAPGERNDVVREVLTGHPMLMDAVARHVYLAYYQHPQVLVAIGEPARPPFPEGFTIAPTDPELLASLEARRGR